MQQGSLIEDAACDDGGVIETCISTSHDNSIYFEEVYPI